MKLLYFLACLAFALFATAFIDDGQALGTTTSILVKRSGWPACGPEPGSDSTISKRGVGYIYLERM
ncbi:unnamed protein product [Penicillium bialowiezense]